MPRPSFLGRQVSATSPTPPPSRATDYNHLRPAPGPLFFASITAFVVGVFPVTAFPLPAVRHTALCSHTIPTSRTTLPPRTVQYTYRCGPCPQTARACASLHNHDNSGRLASVLPPDRISVRLCLSATALLFSSSFLQLSPAFSHRRPRQSEPNSAIPRHFNNAPALAQTKPHNNSPRPRLNSTSFEQYRHTRRAVLSLHNLRANIICRLPTMRPLRQHFNTFPGNGRQFIDLN